MSNLLCNSNDVLRWRSQYPTLHSTVREQFAELNQIYNQQVVTYDPKGVFGKFNLRHPTHPATNLSEARVMSELLYHWGNEIKNVEIASLREEQTSGDDIWVYFTDGRLCTVNVKLATITNEYRGFAISAETRRALKKNTSTYVALVDNINQCWILQSGSKVRDAVYIANFSYEGGRDGIFYDNFGNGYADVVWQFSEDKNEKV